MNLTRRLFLTRVAAAGGASAAYEAMTGLGLLAYPTQAPFDLTGRAPGARSGPRRGTRRADRRIRARQGRLRLPRARSSSPAGRPGVHGEPRHRERRGRPAQTAAFDDGLYFNAGPMRISHHHHTTLAYCRELQVPVEVFVADSDSAYLYQTRSSTLNGRRVRLREARADFDGYIAELLSKALSQTQLDQPLTNDDRERLLAYLRRLGALDQQRHTGGSPRRSGYESAVSARCACVTCSAPISTSTWGSIGTPSPP